MGFITDNFYTYSFLSLLTKIKHHFHIDIILDSHLGNYFSVPQKCLSSSNIVLQRLYITSQSVLAARFSCMLPITFPFPPLSKSVSCSSLISLVLAIDAEKKENFALVSEHLIKLYFYSIIFQTHQVINSFSTTVPRVYWPFYWWLYSKRNQSCLSQFLGHWPTPVYSNRNVPILIILLLSQWRVWKCLLCSE